VELQVLRSSGDVVEADLAHITAELDSEFAEMGGATLLITGAAGFLGYYLVQGALSWNDHHGRGARIRVIASDNFVRGRPDWLSAIDRRPDLKVLTHDVTTPLPDDIGPIEYIIHAAGIASPIIYRRLPIETMDANVNGLRLLLERSRRQSQEGHRVKGFLFYSSSEIYGDPLPQFIPTAEDYRGNVSCTGPRACYDESKRYGETLCVNFAAVHGVPTRQARPFNNYGPGLKITDGRVIPDFSRCILDDKDIVMLSDGSPKRTFCYAADAIVGYYKVLVRGRDGEPYNIGTESPEISMRELADRIADAGRELFGYSGKVVHGVSQDSAYLVDNPNRRCPVIAKARAELGYTPVVGLDDGLRRTLLWYADHRVSEEK
jgi:dTDP-glucose 4,6-dehydratase/UDP-glucuronate decarboxylase